MARTTLGIIAVSAATALLVGAGGGWAASSIAWSAEAESTASFGCYDVSTGGLILIPAGQDCATGLVPVVWQTAAAEGGEPGEPGERGAAGADGVDGLDGLDGQQGEPGATGAQGATGVAGDQGASGADGATGVAGAQGEPGTPGATGPHGADGEDGAAGAAGAVGPHGATGATGATGEQGEKGDVGVAAWATVAAWDATVPYSAGPPASVVTHLGSTYLAAASSLGTVPGSGGTEWIQIAAAGAKGEQGDAGPAGPQGPQGVTGVSGPVGATGPAGPQGPQGEPGVAGPVGATGPAGADGAQGEKGDPGETGPAGPVGPVGPVGPADTTFSSQFGDTYVNGQVSDGGNGADCTLGAVGLTAATYAPGPVADGRLLNITSNTTLYALLGNRFGGDGVTTFKLPDLRSVAPNGLTYYVCTQGVFPTKN